MADLKGRIVMSAIARVLSSRCWWSSQASKTLKSARKVKLQGWGVDLGFSCWNCVSWALREGAYTGQSKGQMTWNCGILVAVSQEGKLTEMWRQVKEDENWRMNLIFGLEQITHLVIQPLNQYLESLFLPEPVSGAGDIKVEGCVSYL